MATETKTFYPGAYDANLSSVKTVNGAANPVGKGSSNTTYATMISEPGGSLSVFWPFDVSSIPENATINSVSCKAKAKVANTSITTTAQLQMYSGSTGKGSATSFRNTTAQTYTLAPGSWTRAELAGIRLRVYAVSTASSYQANAWFYGADLTVTYTYQSEKFMLKLGGAWHDIARVFKKVNGIWVEQTELASVIEDGVRYKNGGEIVSPYKTVTITGSGSSSWCYVTINGTKYTSAASVKVESGATVQITVGGDVAKYCYVSLDGTNVLSGSGTYTYTVTEDCSMKLAMTVHETYYTCGSVEITTGGGSSANLISFTVDGVSYQAEEGMTWTQFIASSYNQDNYFRDAFGGVYTDDGWVYTSSGVNPTVEDAIIPGEAYYTQ